VLLMPEIFGDLEEEKFDEEWKVVIAPTKAEYVLGKIQARILMQAIADKEKAVVFESFIVSIPFIAEFYRVRRFLKGVYQLPPRASEKPYEPVPPEKWEEFKKKAYQVIGKSTK